MKKVFFAVRGFAGRCSRDNLTVYGAQASFFLVLSMVPFLMVMISLIQFLLPANGKEILEQIILLLPTVFQSGFNRIIQELFNMSATSVLSVSVVLSLWTASKGIMGIEQGLHAIYHVKETDNYLVRRLRCMLYTLIFLFAVIAALALLVLGSSITKMLGENLSFFSRIARILLAFRLLISMVIFVTAFTLGYRYLTGVRCRFLEALPGVLFSTIGWMIFSAGYSFYIANFSNYTYVYGSLAALMLMMLWIYFCILILLAGAELNLILAEKQDE